MLRPMSCAAPLSIGTLARLAGCTVPTIRYYESIGLLPEGPRTDAGRRVYGEAAVQRLSFIRRCREFGFSIPQVRELVERIDDPQRPCVEVREVAARHLAQVQARLVELQALERQLTAVVAGCDQTCAGGAAVDCTILEDLSPGPANCCATRQGDRPPQRPTRHRHPGDAATHERCGLPPAGSTPLASCSPVPPVRSAGMRCTTNSATSTSSVPRPKVWLMAAAMAFVPA